MRADDGSSFEDDPELLKPQSHPSLDRARRQLKRVGDLMVAEPAEVGQLDHSSLLGRQPLERAAHARGLVATQRLLIGQGGRSDALGDVRVADVAPVGDQRTPDGGQRQTVLVIDDDPIVHDLLTRLLAREGLQVVSAFSGAEGLRLAAAVRPAVITLDVMMPGLDGWAVLTALKGNPDLADIPIIVVTITDDKNMGYALGAADYLMKPIEPARLTAVLKKHTSMVQRASVLVVDDDADMRDMTARLLSKSGCEVQVAENGRVALDRLERHIRSPHLEFARPVVDQRLRADDQTALHHALVEQ